VEAFSVFASMGIADAVSGPLGKMRQAFTATGSEGNRFGNRMGGIAKKMMPIAIVAGLILSALAPTIGVAADFEAGISNLGAISRASSREMALMEQSALDLGASTAFSAGQVVGAQTELAKKGFTANQVVGAMPGLLDLAAAAQSDLATAASISSGALKSFNMSASESGQVADIIASASTTSATDIDGIGMALQNAGAVVAGAGGDFALLAAITGKLADANINAAVAGTSTKIMFNRLAAPTGAAAKALSSLGVVTKDANGNMMPFLDIMGSLETSLDGMGSADRAAYLKNIFGEEAIGSVTALLNQGVDSLGEYADALRHSTGSAAEMAQKKLDNLKGSLTILDSATEGLSITVGSIFTPILKPMVDALTTVVGWLNIMAGHPLGKAVLVMAAGISIAVIALTVFSGVMWAASAAAAVLNLTLLANPIGLVVMGLFALGALIVAFWEDIAGLFAPFVKVIQDVWDILINVGPLGVLAYYFNDTYNFIIGLWDGLTGFFSGLWDGITAGVSLMVNGLVYAFMNFTPLGCIIKGFQGIRNFIANFDLAESGRALLETLTAGIKNTAMAPFKAVKGALSKVRKLLPFSDAKEGPLSTLTLSGQKVMDTLGSGVKNAAMAPFKAVKGALSKVRKLLPFGDAKDGPLSALTLSGQKLMETLGSGIQIGAPVLAKTAMGALAGISTAIGTTVANFLPHKQENEKSASAAVAKAGSGQRSGRQLVIENLVVQLPGVSDATGFVRELEELVATYDGGTN